MSEHLSRLWLTPDFQIDISPIEILDCTVVIDQAEVPELGLEFVGTGTTIANSEEGIPSSGNVLATNRPLAMDPWREVLPGGQLRFSTFVTSREGPVARELIQIGDQRQIALSRITIGDHLVSFTFRADTDDAIDGTGLIAVLDSQIAAQSAADEIDQARISESLRLLQLIKALDGLGLPVHDELPREDEPEEANAQQSRLVDLRGQYDDLERRYQALSNSLLGRITLRYWKFRTMLRKRVWSK